MPSLNEACTEASCIYTLSIIARCSASLTLLGSLFILQDVLKDATRRSLVKNKIIVSMSLSDFILNFFGPILGLIMIPAENDFGINTSGNFTTCAIQGFFYVCGGIMSSCYNATLAVCFVLIFKYRYTEEEIQKLQSWFLYLPLAIALAVTVPAIPLEVYNFSELLWACDFAGSPTSCYVPGEEKCRRGESAEYFHYALFVVVAVSVSAIVTAMYMLYKEVSRQEGGLRGNHNFAQDHSFQRRSSSHLSASARNAGLFYSLAYLVTFLPLSVTFFWKPMPLWLHAILAISFHLIGFINALVYTRPMFILFRSRYPHLNWFSTCWHVMVRTVPSSLTHTGTIPPVDAGQTRMNTLESPTRDSLMPSRAHIGDAEDETENNYSVDHSTEDFRTIEMEESYITSNCGSHHSGSSNNDLGSVEFDSNRD